LTIRCRQDRDLSDHDMISIDYIDTSPGLTEDRREEIFNPTVSLLAGGDKEDNGLVRSYLAVRDHGGRIDVDSAPGRGATFRVVLPV
jgi:two-component system, NtrC family, sensor kinase